MSTYAARTKVSVDRSKQEIEKILRRYKADQFSMGWRQDKAALMFRMSGRFIRILLPLPLRGQFSSQTGFEQAERQRYRALALSLKAKLEAVESKIETLDEAFMAHIILPDGKTMSETYSPQIESAYKSGKMPLQIAGY